MSNANPQAPAAPETANPKAEEQKADSAAEAQAAADKAVAAERKRQSEIRALCKEKELAVSFADRLVDDGVPLEDAKRQINNLAEYMASEWKADSHPGSVEITRDGVETMRHGASKALLNRFKPADHKIEGDDPAREFANMSLMDMARKFVDASGKKLSGMSRVEIAQAALHSTSDFPLILENVVGKSLRDAYELSPRTFQVLGSRETLPDLKEVSRVRTGSGPSLQKVQEGGEYTYGELDEEGEKYRVFKYGKILALTWEALINDDLGAFTSVPAKLGAAAAQNESDVFWAELTGNPTMADGNALFSATHGNLAGSGAALSVDALSAGRTAMRKQKDGEFFLNVQPAFLVVPPDIETDGERLISQNMLADSAGNINPFSNRLQLVSEPRLGAASTTAWYLWASPNNIDTIAYAFLQGEEGPQIETHEGFDVDGMKVKVRHVFGAKAIDHRGLYQNPGA